MKAATISRIAMRPILSVLPVVALLALAGCATNPGYNQGPILGQTAAPVEAPPPDQTQVASAPSQVVATGVENLDISAFTDPGAFKSMSDASKSQASSAQYYALAFGRVGAARTWAGDSGVTGQVNVGPFVKVNNRDCRDFTNVVNVASKSYTKRGTACRGDDGRWDVGLATAAPAAALAGAAPALMPTANGTAG
ncbi:MAG: hypothetical protein ABI377_06900 [Devosia sp.]